MLPLAFLFSWTRPYLEVVRLPSTSIIIIILFFFGVGGFLVLSDPQVVQQLIPYREEVDALSEQEVGKTLVFLDGTRISCRMFECNLGNFIADAYVHLVGANCCF